MSDHRQYNLPGFGLVRVRLFPCVREVSSFLENYGHITRLRELDQLGPIRQVLPGAHHTRYEYLMAQLAIVTELCHLRGQLPAGLSLARDRDSFGSPLEGSVPSNGEILMVLALLGNVGHLPSTFSGERALLKYLRDNGGPRAAFRLGLDEADRERFDAVVASNQLYRVNYYVALFLLNRYRRRENGPRVVGFCQRVVRSYLNMPSDDPDQSLLALWSLYRSVRRLTYLALDSHYAPVPFSLDLASIFLSLEHYLSDVFVEDSTFQRALAQLEVVMRDAVYMGAEPQINHARVGEAVLSRLEALSPEPTTIGQMWDLLGPDRDSSDRFSPPAPERDPDQSLPAVVQLNYEVDPAISTRLLPDPMEWERESRAAVGLRSCRFAADLDPSQSHLKVTAALLKASDTRVAQKTAHRVAKQLVDFNLRVAEAGAPIAVGDATANGLALLRFLLPQLLGSARRFRLRTKPAVGSPPIVWAYGSTRTAGLVSEYGRWASQSGLCDADQLNEVAQLEAALRHIDYRGALIAFAGSTEVIEGGSLLAEVDGLVVLLSRDLRQPALILVEAKNTANGHTAAQRQLRDQRDRLGIAQDRFEIHALGNKGAYAALTLA